MAPQDLVWLAIDCSGSVGGTKAYFAKVKEILQLSSPSDTSYYMWNSKAEEKTFSEVQSWLEKQQGHGGTSPSDLARVIVEKSFHGVLRVITDGEVCGGEVDACDRLLHGSALLEGEGGHIFEKVEVYIVETGAAVNLSATLPFTRFSPFEVEYLPRGGDGCAPTLDAVSVEDLALFDAFLLQQGDVDFEAKADRLKEVARARFMGTGGSARVRDAAIQTKKRLTEQMSRRLGDAVGDELLRLLEATEDRSADAKAMARQLVDDFLFLKGEAPALKALDAVIGLCEGVARHCFSKADAERAISTPAQRAEAMPQPADPLPLAEPGEEEEASDEAWFQCPVTLEESTSDLALTLAWADGQEGRCFVDGLEEDFKKLLATNPLWLWTREDHVERFAALLDDLLSCQALRRARELGAPISVSPTTRRPLVATFPLSSSSPAHVRARRWALAKAVSGGKRWGNPELWFVNLALVVQRKRVSERVQQALPLLLRALRSQLASAKSYASLSGLPELPVTRVPTSVACWLVAAGPTYDYPKIALQLLPLRRELLWVVEELMGYRLPEGAPVELERLHIVQAAREWRLGRRPRDVSPSPFDGADRLDNLLLALSQKCLRISREDAQLARTRSPSKLKLVEFIALDGAAEDEQRRVALELLPPAFQVHARGCGWRDLLRLATAADPAKKPSECVPSAPLATCQEAASEPFAAAVVDWGYGLRRYEKSSVPLCPATSRPFSRVARDDPGSPQLWQEAAESFYGFAVGEAMLSGHESYGNFVAEMGFYPSAAEFSLYLRQKWILSGKKRTLPHLMEQFASEIMESVAPVVSVLGPAEFAARFEASRSLEARKRMEESHAEEKT